MGFVAYRIKVVNNKMRNKLAPSKVWKQALCRDIINQLKEQSQLKAIHAEIGKRQLTVVHRTIWETHMRRSMV